MTSYQIASEISSSDRMFPEFWRTRISELLPILPLSVLPSPVGERAMNARLSCSCTTEYKACRHLRSVSFIVLSTHLIDLHLLISLFLSRPRSICECIVLIEGDAPH